ncbi:capsular polysaccharide biosynthesis protein [Caldovatus sediminis]|uniref:Capsular polysaccharide biosynthesis protein n=1 Tax=Caldovatus sediminis TaxID=2041189 RepID=A0A8J2ZCA6_9PROT|nr:capsular polysaccharide biosynthesis protein [Caldovatus sediminis]GGG34298.1 capsular polysaccharide biosynthesis protein [Caldovatus sediminis]
MAGGAPPPFVAEAARGASAAGTPRYGTFSRGIATLPGLAAFLPGGPAAMLRLRPRADEAAGLTALLGWGRKPSAARAQGFAARHRRPYWSLEDGFLRMPGPPGRPAGPPLSLLLDREGVYYDAYAPSELEALLREAPLGADAALMARAAAALGRWLALGLSKYLPRPREGRPRGGAAVLVLGQAPGDLSLSLGMAETWGPAALCHLAAAENPGARVVYRLHPDVVHGLRPPPGDLALVRRCAVIDASGGPLPEALAEARRVYCATSLAGFEALLRGIPVTVTGLPFWAGWGAADERATAPARRGVRRSPLEIFAAAFLLYPLYRDPRSGRPLAFEEALEIVAAARRRGA